MRRRIEFEGSIRNFILWLGITDSLGREHVVDDHHLAGRMVGAECGLRRDTLL